MQLEPTSTVTADIEAAEQQLRLAQPLEAQQIFRRALAELGYDPRALQPAEVEPLRAEADALTLRALHGLATALADEGTQQSRLAALGYAAQARDLAAHDPEALVRAHLLLGRIKLKLSDFEGAQAEFERAGAEAEAEGKLAKGALRRRLEDLGVNPAMLDDVQERKSASPILKAIKSVSTPAKLKSAGVAEERLAEATMADVAALPKEDTVVVRARAICTLFTSRYDDAVEENKCVQRAVDHFSGASTAARIGSWNVRATSVQWHGLTARLPAKVRTVADLFEGEGLHVLAIQEAPGAGADERYKFLDKFEYALPSSLEHAACPPPTRSTMVPRGRHELEQQVVLGLRRRSGLEVGFGGVLTHGEAMHFLWDAAQYEKLALGVVEKGGFVACTSGDAPMRQHWRAEMQRQQHAPATEPDAGGANAADAGGAWFKRPPALVVLRERAASARLLCVVSVHNKSWDGKTKGEETRREATLLADVAMHAERLVASLAPAANGADAAGGGAVVVTGDFNLGPPSDTGARSAPGSAFDGLVARGYDPQLPAGTAVTNIEALVETGQLYDNAWVRTGGGYRCGGGRVCELFRERTEAVLRDYKAGLDAAKAAAGGNAFVRDFFGSRKLNAAFQSTFYSEFSDHTPIVCELRQLNA